jgi:DNA polymerase I-like protein with 3'-5' exonuclease and polymerase domains
MRLIFDIETDGLNPTLVWCICAIDVDSGKEYSFRPDEVEEGVQFIGQATELIGHNIMGYDLPALEKLYGFKPTCKITDSLILTRLIWADVKDHDFNNYRAGAFPARLIGSHSLKAWGYRLQIFKDDFGETTDWSEYSEEMLEYCMQDVRVTAKLFARIESKNYSSDAIELEHEIHRICLQQTKNGFPFNVQKAVQLQAQLNDRATELKRQLQERFGGWWESKGLFTPKRTQGMYTEGQRLTKVSWVDFNPRSREHIAKKLKELGWKPSVFTETGLPKVDESILKELKFPEAELLCEYLLIEKRLGQLAEGKNAWLKLEKDGKIHGEVITNGTVTSRCTHQRPNMSQVPSVNAPYGVECRSLFYAPDGYVLLGMDMSGLELRCLAHMTHQWDGGAYGKEILEGDIHTANQQAAGLPDRQTAKVFIYSFLYGAGDEKIGKTIGKGRQAGKALKDRFLERTPAIKNLRDAVAKQVQQHNSLRGLDGRRFNTRSEHSAVNTLLQGTGAILCKRWVVMWHQMLKEAGYVDGKDYLQVAFVHDEIQMLVKEMYADKIAEIGLNAIKQTGEYYNFNITLDGEYKLGSNWAETH